ncbi:MAG: DUF1080 domain-containing protein [Pirellulaceae bacterium]|nr:DUF1080 domain-containing protein [Pirellulaceae bacterium]
MIRSSLLAALALTLALPLAADEPKPAADKKDDWMPLFDGKSLEGWKKTSYGGEGEVKVEKGELVLEAGATLTGVTYTKGDSLPKDNYEISLQAMKLQGDDFFCGLTFPVRDTHASYIVGGWGGTVVGVSSINGFDASENETTVYRKFEPNKWYSVRVRVAGGKIECWANDEQTADVEIKDRKISTRSEVDPNRPLGISTYQVKAAIKDVKIRKLK